MFGFMFAVIVYYTAIWFASAICHPVISSELEKKYDNILKHIDALTDEQKRHFK